LLIPIVGFVLGSMGGAVARIPLIGWGKPTPVNPLRWHNKDLANIMVSLAGIFANLILALIGFVIFKAILMMGGFGIISESLRDPIRIFLVYLLTMNVSLAIFNLLPFPPLDGSKILYSILPASAHGFLTVLEQYGFMILLVLMYMGFFGVIIGPVMYLVDYLLRLGVPPSAFFQ
jgi:Zn-dependent protease